MNIDEIYMRRALRLAKAGEGHVSPNPMVGAVIVCDGRIIGEGWHRAYGQAHAEVNAISSVRPADKPLLSKSTLYVTLEPCSHYGKTPPCSKLIIESRIPRVVVGSCDPFSKVSGKGIKMLQDAGIDVAVGILENECRNLNARFMTAHTHHRPHIMLKWAESSDRFVDIARDSRQKPALLSTPATLLLSHKLRASSDAIMIGANTLQLDNPSLTTRFWHGRNPIRVVVSHDRCRALGNSKIFTDGLPTWVFSDSGDTIANPNENVEEFAIEDSAHAIEFICETLYHRGITSLLVEGGPCLTNEFLKLNLWDEIRVEQSPIRLGNGVKAPQLPNVTPAVRQIGDNNIFHFHNPALNNYLCFV